MFWRQSKVGLPGQSYYWQKITKNHAFNNMSKISTVMEAWSGRTAQIDLMDKWTFWQCFEEHMKFSENVGNCMANEHSLNTHDIEVARSRRILHE